MGEGAANLEPLLRAEAEIPTDPRPSVGLLFPTELTAELRSRLSAQPRLAAGWQRLNAGLQEKSRQLNLRPRVAEAQRWVHLGGFAAGWLEALAFAGLMGPDPARLRHAAELALTVASAAIWSDGGTDLGGITGRHRQAQWTRAVALASDWAADALSPPGRAKLWRALAELGLPGLHHKLIRQRSEGGEDVRPWLTPSGVLGYRALAAAYPDYAPRAAEMEAELTSALQVAFDDTGQRVGGGNIAELEAVWPALLALARHHGHPLSQCLPPPLLRAGTWLRAMTGVVGPAGTPLPVGHTPIHSPPPYLTAEVLANLTDTPPWTAPPGQTPPAIGSPLHLLLAATLPFEAGPTDRPEPPPAAALPTLTVLPRAGSFVLRHADPRFGPTLFHATAGSTQQPAHHCDVGAILWQIKDQPLLVDPGGGPDRGSIQHHTAVVPLDPQGEPREPNGSGRLIGVHPWGPGCLAAFDLSPAYQAVQPAEATDGCSLSRRIIAADPRMIVLEDLLRSPSPPQLASRTLFITTQPAETIHYELGGMTHTAYRVSVGTSAVLWICCVNWQPATVRCDELTFSGKPQHLHRLCLDTAAAPDLRCLTALQLLPAGSADRPDPFWPLAPHVFTTNDGRLTLRQQPNAELSLTRIEPDGQEHHARFANGSWHLAPEDLATEDP